ncbi:AAA family ATPase [Raoultella ornithinolytica]|uniref:AAA family ATPase n=1 Tax=Raoultella TaxID=160674 RepID=UPI0011512E4B|nr:MULTISPECIES: AAA family ATPase [Raoultella]MEB8237786.1 AAA family ATPase [Raoultella ornithinolytica]TQN56394.1 AAA family ATPase [Raoultella planticola]
MTISFKCLPRKYSVPLTANNILFLEPDNWDDFGYKTLFSLYLFDEKGCKHELGNTKIGYIQQSEGWTSEKLPESFIELPPSFFSLGQDADFYQAVFKASLETNYSIKEILAPLRDVTYSSENLSIAEKNDVFSASLLRSVDHSSITQQFSRILDDKAPLTSFSFSYQRNQTSSFSGIRLNFETTPNAEPPTNIHILIGRNGVGKTTMLNQMVDTLIPERSKHGTDGAFYQSSIWDGSLVQIPDNYFTGVVSVSFSAFDTFIPPKNRDERDSDIRYRYVGLKKMALEGQWTLKNNSDLGQDCANSLKVCLALKSKRNRWLKAVETLSSDPNFSEMPLEELIEHFESDISEKKSNFEKIAINLFSRMSSGHCIVLLTITNLIETVEEKTLVLIDEPESHLHPPLLSAFTRALSNLLKNRNGVAIIATHSPVVLQEVPKSCVSIINRSRLSSRVDRPNIETFAENVGVLTREVFELEVSKSGFHNLLEDSVRQGSTYDSIISKYDNQLGNEGKAILRSMLFNKNRSGKGQ